MSVLTIVVSLLGGLALFLYGMSVMSDTLSQMTGGGLDSVIEKITRNRYMGFAAGAVMTAIIQTSSATTVLTVGFVNAGIMKLNEAFGLIVGANLGSTMNSWILSLNSIEGGTFLLELCRPSFFVPVLSVAGILLKMTAKSDKKKLIADAIIGFSVMMTGMMLMSTAIEPLEESDAFQSLIATLSNPLLAFLVSLGFTMIVQSSDATVGILQVIALSSAMTMGMAIPMVCGAQIGTCITALLSSLGTSNNGKRTALLHLYYNLLKTIPFLMVLFIINSISPIAMLEAQAKGMRIPMFHTLINIAAAAVYLPLSRLFVKLAELTIPYNEKEMKEKESVLTMLDARLLINPGVAYTQVHSALTVMAQTVSDTFALLIDKTNNYQERSGEIVLSCDRIRKYRSQIIGYLADISGKNSDEQIIREVQYAQNTCEALGNIGKIIAAVLKLKNDLISRNMSFSGQGIRDIDILTEAVHEIVDTTVYDLEVTNRSLSETIGYFREAVSELHAEIISRHLKRLHERSCKRDAGMVFMDICFLMEKIIDSCDMVAGSILDYSELKMIKTEDKRVISPEKRLEYIMHLYKDKYLELLNDNKMNSEE